jgi:hypothetical protein
MSNTGLLRLAMDIQNKRDKKGLQGAPWARSQ